MSLPAATKLGQGNVFTGVCDSVHRGCLPQCMLGYTPPPGSRHPPGVDPMEQTPRSRHPPQQTPPRADTPWRRHPPGVDTPREQTPRAGTDTPREQTPQEQTPAPGQAPGSRPPPRDRHPPRKQTTAYVNERLVRILLECILVQAVTIAELK